MKNYEYDNKEYTQSGFSILELIIVLLVMSILLAVTTKFTSAEVYKADQQANKVSDVFLEAKYRAITTQDTMRVEFNATDRTVTMIDENQPGDTSDDIEIKTVSLTDGVEFNKPPPNIEAKPIEPTPVPDVTFKSETIAEPTTEPTPEPPPEPELFYMGDDNETAYFINADGNKELYDHDEYLKSLEDYEKALADAAVAEAGGTPTVETSADQIATFRFLQNGNVVDAGLNANGDGAVVTGATIYFWTPTVDANGNSTSNGGILRALTLLGSSGKTNYWKCPVVDGVCKDWIK